MGAPSGTKNAASRTSREAAVTQNAAAFSRGNAIPSAPICAGSTRFGNALCGTTVSTKNTISVPCIVTNAR